MSPANLPSVDINELNFDTCERLRHLDSLLAQLGLQQGARVLDVGGYPGYMARAFPHWNVVTADTYAKGHPPYVKASGAALPFPDATFDATIACDVLEHVPPQFRDAFLRELARVTRSAVIVAGPYNTPGAAKAEEVVRELLPVSSPAQAWLAEHAECGLPALEQTRRSLGNAAGTGVMPIGSLTAWILFFAAQAAGETEHSTGESVKHFMHSYNQLHQSGSAAAGAHACTGSYGPAYRHAVIAAMDAATALRLAELTGQGAAGSEHPAENRNVENYVVCLGDLLKLAFQKSEQPGTALTDAADMNTNALAAQYIDRLERMLRDRDLTLPERIAADQGRDNNPHKNDSKITHPEKLSARIAAAWRLLRGRQS